MFIRVVERISEWPGVDGVLVCKVWWNVLVLVKTGLGLIFYPKSKLLVSRTLWRFWFRLRLKTRSLCLLLVLALNISFNAGWSG